MTAVAVASVNTGVNQERLRNAIDRVTANVSALSPISFTKTTKGRVVCLAANVEDFGLKTITVRRMCPETWALSGDSQQCAHCIESVAYDANSKQLRIKLVDRKNGAAAEVAAARMWDELSTTNAPVHPSDVAIKVSGIECVNHEPMLVDLVNAIARVSIASAACRSGVVSASVYKFTDEMRARGGLPPNPLTTVTAGTSDSAQTGAKPYLPEYVVSIRGLVVIGPKVLNPANWCKYIPQSICTTLTSLFRVAEAEHRTAISMLTIRALEEYYNGTSRPSLTLCEQLDAESIQNEELELNGAPTTKLKLV